MLKHEAKLINPDAEQIVAALTEATTAANKRCRARLIDDDPAKWRKFARETEATPEGYSMFRGGKGGIPATQILASWWTDAAGRRHVVLRGRRIEHDEAKGFLHKETLDKRPPLWHAYPEYVCRRTVGSESQIVCACGCGVVGTPESLGWMGETCGPCFDRKEEVGSGALGDANLPGVLYGDRSPLGPVACSPDGNRVAAVEGENFVTYWDIPNRTRTVMKFPDIRDADVAITSDGRHLLVSGRRRFDFVVGFLAVFDLTSDPPKRVDPEASAPPLWGVIALREPDLAFVLCSVAMGSRCAGVIVRVPTGETVRSFDLPVDSLGPLSLSPDGSHLAIGTSRLRVFDLRTGANAFDVLATPSGTKAIGYSPDGTRLFIEAAGYVDARDAANGRTLCAEWQHHPLTTSLGGIIRLAVDPTGEFVYAATNQAKLGVLTADTLQRKAVFEWHLGGIRGFAVSADGSRLFTSGGDGCVKVWPIKDLVKGI